MDQSRNRNLGLGVLLVLLGAWFLAVQFVPGLGTWVERYFDWPWIIVGIGLLFVLTGALSGVAELAIPGSIIGGIGGLLYYQNATGDWDSWAYAWTLIPGFVGVGIFITNVLKGRFREALREGSGSIVISVLLFGVFGSFMGGPAILGQYWPVLLILLGLWMLVRPLFGTRT